MAINIRITGFMGEMASSCHVSHATIICVWLSHVNSHPEWRIDVSPTVEEKTTLFAHVLYAGDADTQAMPPCAVTDEGTTIEITAGAFKVRFAKSGAPGGLLMIGGRKLELAGKINKEFYVFLLRLRQCFCLANIFEKFTGQ